MCSFFYLIFIIFKKCSFGTGKAYNLCFGSEVLTRIPSKSLGCEDSGYFVQGCGTRILPLDQ